MFLQIHFLATVLLFIAWAPSVYSIEAHMVPLDPIVLAGSNITVNCILDNTDNGQNSADIIWYYKSSRQPIPSNQYRAVNDTVSQLVLENISFEESGTYLCALPSDESNIVQYEGTVLYVGLPASRPEGLRCHSDNILDYWCEWQEGQTSNLRTQYTLQYRQLFGNTKWQNCPDDQTKGTNTCFISRNNHRGYTQKIRVTATNPLGTAKTEITFNPDLETIPNPPSNVSVESRGPHSLQVTWELPEKWTSYFSMFLEYQLQYASEFNPETWIEVSSREMSGMRRPKPAYILQNLEPHTHYYIRMNCKSMGIMDENHWSDWTEIQTGLTDSSVPTAAVSALDWREYSSHEDPLFKRDVFLQWKKLHRRQQRGKITDYQVNVMLQSVDGETNVYSHKAVSTVIFVLGLEKYRDYYVQISACNVAGCGPNATVYLPDGTREPGAPKNVGTQWESSTSAKVAWEMPSDPNGYVLAYNVQWAPDRKDAEWLSAEVSANETSYLIKDMDQSETSYQFRVQTKNARGYSGWTYSLSLPNVEDFLADDALGARSTQEILKQAAQSLKEMMVLLQRTVMGDVNDSNTQV